MKTIDCQPQQCLMVGNNVTEDMIAAELGMDVFLVTDCLINKHGKPIEVYRQGSLEDLIQYLKQL